METDKIVIRVNRLTIAGTSAITTAWTNSEGQKQACFIFHIFLDVVEALTFFD